MATQVQRRRGTTAQHTTFTGASGEVSVDTSKNVLVVHDGVTAGGHPQPKVSEVQSGQYIWLGSAGGTGDALTASATPAILAYAAGQTFRFKATATNTTAATININSLGDKSIVKTGGAALISSEIVTGSVYQIIYDGTNFHLSSGVGSGGGARAGGVIYENSLTISENYTLTTGSNGLSVGPITIASGISLTIPSGQRYVIL